MIMSRMRGLLVGAAIVLLSVGCGKDKEPAQDTAKETTKEVAVEQQTQKDEPKYITVQHILIGFHGSVPGKPITRSKEEAESLAEEILEKARGGADFDELVKEYTDDSHPGIYEMSNFGVQADMSKRVFARNRMVPAFGNVGFSLGVGDMGIAAHDVKESPYGWHIIKRIK
jgi:hypothetical protein